MGPLYDLQRVWALAQDEDKVQALTRNCRRDVDKFFDGDYAQVAALIRAAKAEDYIDSEWCENGGGGIAACDAYSVRRAEVVHATGKLVRFEYFLKFAIGKAGNLVLVVSCHTS
jgi:hypothetical protein